MNSPSTSSNLQVKAQSSSLLGSDAATRTTFSDLWELGKPRLSMLSVITALVGYLAAQPDRSFSVLISLLLGTTCAAFGAAALNMWMEQDTDALMARTRGRPLPAGSLPPAIALTYGLFLCVCGDLLILWGINGLAATLTLFTQISYLLAYTPLKKKTHWCIPVGAIPGAIPPLIGWASAEGSISLLGWILFAILLTWQIPHFMAIAWTYRNDYAKANLPMLPVVDPTGNRAARQSLVASVTLFGVSFLPFVLGFTTLVYGSIALLAGCWFIYRAFRFWRSSERDGAARHLFFASIAYLPLVLAALVVDRWLFI